MMKEWKRDCCVVVEKDFDHDLHSFDVYGLDGGLLGEITPADIANYRDCVTKLDAGDCPICDGWDDGMSNTCSLAGWGEDELDALVTFSPELLASQEKLRAEIASRPKPATYWVGDFEYEDEAGTDDWPVSIG